MTTQDEAPRRSALTGRYTRLWFFDAAGGEKVLKVLNVADVVHLSEADRMQQTAWFLERANLQRELAESDPAHWAPIEITRKGDKPAVGMASYKTLRRRLEDQWKQSESHLRGRDIIEILVGVIAALRTLEARGRGHGAIKPENVLLADGDTRVLLCDPAADGQLSKGKGRIADRVAIGELLYQLVVGKPPPDEPPERAPTGAPRSLKPQWFEVYRALASGEGGLLDLNSIEHRLQGLQLRPMPMILSVGAACFVLLATGVIALAVLTRPEPLTQEESDILEIRWEGIGVPLVTRRERNDADWQDALGPDAWGDLERLVRIVGTGNASRFTGQIRSDPQAPRLRQVRDLLDAVYEDMLADTWPAGVKVAEYETFFRERGWTEHADDLKLVLNDPDETVDGMNDWYEHARWIVGNLEDLDAFVAHWEAIESTLGSAGDLDPDYFDGALSRAMDELDINDEHLNDIRGRIEPLWSACRELGQFLDGSRWGKVHKETFLASRSVTVDGSVTDSVHAWRQAASAEEFQLFNPQERFAPTLGDIRDFRSRLVDAPDELDMNDDESEAFRADERVTTLSRDLAGHEAAITACIRDVLPIGANEDRYAALASAWAEGRGDISQRVDNVLAEYDIDPDEFWPEIDEQIRTGLTLIQPIDDFFQRMVAAWARDDRAKARELRARRTRLVELAAAVTAVFQLGTMQMDPADGAGAPAALAAAMLAARDAYLVGIFESLDVTAPIPTDEAIELGERRSWKDRVLRLAVDASALRGLITKTDTRADEAIEQYRKIVDTATELGLRSEQVLGDQSHQELTSIISVREGSRADATRILGDENASRLHHDAAWMRLADLGGGPVGACGSVEGRACSGEGEPSPVRREGRGRRADRGRDRRHGRHGQGVDHRHRKAGPGRVRAID